MAATRGCARSRPPAPHVFFFSLFFSLFFLLLQEFPGDIVNPYDDRHVTLGDRAIHAAVDGWLHCFREPAKVLPLGVPRILVRERGGRVVFFLSDIPILLTSSLLTFSFLLRSSPSPTSPTPPAGTAAAPSSPGALPNSTTSSTRTRAASGTTLPATGRSRSTPLSNWSPAATRPSTSWAGTRPRSPG